MAIGTDSPIASILDRCELVAVDAGARTDIPEHWIKLDGHARFIAFEPDAAACASLRSTYDMRGHGSMYQIVPTALAKSDGTRTLHITNTPSGSSLLCPDTPLNRAYVDHDYLFPITTRTVETRALASVLDELDVPHIEMLKIDVEGAAIEVMEGLGPRDTELLSVEVELALNPQCVGEKTLFDFHGYMLERGFELLDMRPMYSRLTRNGAADAYQRDVFNVHADSPTLSGRLLHVEAIYFRTPLVVVEQSVDAIRRMVIVYSTYGFFAEAYELAERAQHVGRLSEPTARALCAAIVAWHDCRRIPKVFNTPSPMWHVVRQATKMVGMADRVAEELRVGGARMVLRKIIQRARDGQR